jgi:hypothetical protein
VNLNAIILRCPADQLEELVEIALLPDHDTEIYLDDWIATAGVTEEVMEGGWTRYYDFILAARPFVLTG